MITSCHSLTPRPPLPPGQERGSLDTKLTTLTLCTITNRTGMSR